MASYVRGVASSEREALLPTQGAQVQNVKAARVYVFGEGNAVEDDDEEVVEYEMRSRHKKYFSQKPDDSPRPEFFEREVHEGETLQAIALKYACNVSELKRLNNLIQDQEFFALKTVKVPIARYGVLSESSEVKKGRQNAMVGASALANGATAMSDEEYPRGEYYYDSESQHDFSDPETQMKVMKTISIGENFSKQGKEAKKFLRKMDEDLGKLKLSRRSERESLTEVISFLTNKSIRPLDKTVNSTKHNGADCGISWWSIVIWTLVISIILPLGYGLYYWFFVYKPS